MENPLSVEKMISILEANGYPPTSSWKRSKYSGHISLGYLHINLKPTKNNLRSVKPYSPQTQSIINIIIDRKPHKLDELFQAYYGRPMVSSYDKTNIEQVLCRLRKKGIPLDYKPDLKAYYLKKAIDKTI